MNIVSTSDSDREQLMVHLRVRLTDYEFHLQDITRLWKSESCVDHDMPEISSTSVCKTRHFRTKTFYHKMSRKMENVETDDSDRQRAIAPSGYYTLILLQNERFA